ncbi:MAG TPA: hypothetical protein QF353_05225 [Gammaproteobacteria bacterium]|nr:hypothetical protein [Gammaproteobacteria bacterium]
MIIWFLILMWQAYQDWKTLTIHVIGNIILLIISLYLGSFDRIPCALLLYISLHLLDLSKHLNQSMGEGDRQLLAISFILLPWTSWCHILWLSFIPFVLIQRTQHPLYAYYSISHITYHMLS